MGLDKLIVMREMQAFVIFSGKSVFRNITKIVCA